MTPMTHVKTPGARRRANEALRALGRIDDALESHADALFAAAVERLLAAGVAPAGELRHPTGMPVRIEHEVVLLPRVLSVKGDSWHAPGGSEVAIDRMPDEFTATRFFPRPPADDDRAGGDGPGRDPGGVVR